MKPRFHAGVVFALCACAAGCVVPGTSPVTTGTATLAGTKTIAADDVRDAITIGKSTKADIIAALGKTKVVSFDSGFEVWVYQIIGERITGEAAAKPSWVERMLHAGSEKGITRGKTEFVVLFTPSGVVAKTRIRPAPAPGEAARSLMVAYPRLAQTEANSKAWLIGKKLLEKAIANRLDFAFESTLGANTIPALLREAAQQGYEVHVWYAGLARPELHLARVKSRVRKGGHDIPEADIRRRYEHSRLNIIDLLPHLATLRVYDNSADADPAKGLAPEPVLVLHMERGKILNAVDLPHTPGWAKPLVAAALVYFFPSPRRLALSV